LLRSPLRHLIFGIGYMLIVITASTSLYVSVGWSVGDAFYMVILTVFTVGFDEVRPIDTVLLRTITECTIFFGCTGMIFVTGALFQFITISQLQQLLGTTRMKSQIDQLKDHVIVCGYGRIGQMLARELKAGGRRFVIVEQSEERLTTARETGYLGLHGDATDEECLKAAGVMRARTIATVLPDDAANVFITLSARNLNKSLQIIARGEAPSTERKLIHAGADRVVMPTHIGAERIAELILNGGKGQLETESPDLQNIEAELLKLGLDLDIVTVPASGPWSGQTIAAIEAQGGGKFFVVQVKQHNGETLTRPDGDTVIQPGDGLVVVSRGAGL
jgi:voltage-gated potassium channel Kch